jgi:carboxymethylenebutenolidase
MNDRPNEIEELVHLYIDGAFNRRELVKRVAKHTGSAAAAVAALQAFGLPRRAAAQCVDDVRVPADAPDIETQTVEYLGPGGTVFGYLARPREVPGPARARAALQPTERPAVVVIHENRGINDHIKDVVRRVARAGYVGLGPDLVSRQGGTHNFPDPQQATQALNRVGAAAQLEDLMASVDYLKELPFVQAGRIGVVGFCFGGGMVWNLALNRSDLAALVPFYGAPPAADQLDRVSAPVLGIYAETDRNLTGRMAPVVTGLLERRKSFGFHIYDGVGHAFHNDTGAAYNRAAACDAWARTLAFFDKHLRRA